MGGQLIAIDQGAAEWPVVTSSVTAGWQDGETAAVAGPTVYATTDKAMKPDNTLGITMKITRRALKQSGSALEQAVRRDMAGAIGQAMDLAVFQGTGANGQPLGVIAGAAPTASPSGRRCVGRLCGVPRAVAAFMQANAAAGRRGCPGHDPSRAVRLHRRASSSARRFPSSTAWPRAWVRSTPRATGLPAPSGTPDAVGAADDIERRRGTLLRGRMGRGGRDPRSVLDAASGGLRLTALATMDVTVARPVQLRVLTGLELA